MTYEQKELLLKDLCARLPYGVRVHLIFDKNLQVTRELGLNSLHDIMFGNANGKPYLRQMSSMTEEEAKEMCKTVCSYDKITALQIISDRVRYGIIHNGSFNHVTLFFNKIYSLKQLDWLLAHHFDYRSLIPKRLAIEVTKENNPYKN